MRRVPEAPAERCARLQRALAEVDAELQELREEEAAAAQEGGAAEVAAPGAAAAGVPATDGEAGGKPRATDVSVIIGTSELAKDPAMVERIMTMVNTSYYESIKDLLAPGQKSYERLSLDEVIDRLEMGDAGLRANRVLHVAYRGDTLTPSSVVGCMSSTYQPPWTERGCGHWGLLVVDVNCQGQGIASVLIAAAERRLAGACHEIQVEYEYTPGHAYSERLAKWYEGSCGFRCVSGRGRGGGTQFRKCRKPIPPEEARRGRRERLMQVRAEVAAQLAELQGAVAAEGTSGAGTPCVVPL